MPIKPENIIRHEFIGLQVEIKDSKDPKKKGIQGKVVDETKKTLKIEGEDKKYEIPKNETEFLFKLPEGQKVKVDGRVIVGRPEERIKKKFPDKWEPLD